MRHSLPRRARAVTTAPLSGMSVATASAGSNAGGRGASRGTATPLPISPRASGVAVTSVSATLGRGHGGGRQHRGVPSRRRGASGLSAVASPVYPLPLADGRGDSGGSSGSLHRARATHCPTPAWRGAPRRPPSPSSEAAVSGRVSGGRGRPAYGRRGRGRSSRAPSAVAPAGTASSPVRGRGTARTPWQGRAARGGVPSSRSRAMRCSTSPSGSQVSASRACGAPAASSRGVVGGGLWSGCRGGCGDEGVGTAGTAATLSGGTTVETSAPWTPPSSGPASPGGGRSTGFAAS